MKKTVAIILLLAVFCLAGCGTPVSKQPDLGGNIVDNTAPSVPDETQEPETEGELASAEELFEQMLGVYTCDMHDGSVYYTYVYKDGDGYRWEDGYLNSGFFFTGSVSDIIHANPAAEMVACVVNYDAIPPSDMDPEGTEAFSVSYTLGLSAADVGIIDLITDDGTEIHLLYSGTDLENLNDTVNAYGYDY